MAFSVEIDTGSGFCGGVIRAVSKAEEILSEANGKNLYSLGAIVHNEAELKRLGDSGLKAVGIDDLGQIPGHSNVLIRAHGEPPSTYKKLEQLEMNVIDCTCPVVLRLQKSIREAYTQIKPLKGQIIIFGKVGHAEVLGLLGQVDGDALVIENMQMLSDAFEAEKVCLDGPIEIFSQTTKSPAEYASICSVIEERMSKEHELSPVIFKGTGLLKIHNTICHQVADRHGKLSDFALRHDIIIFISGKDSSNGKVLCNLCRSLNIRTYHISEVKDIRPEWFRADDKVGICGATSTPKWLLEDAAKRIMEW